MSILKDASFKPLFMRFLEVANGVRYHYPQKLVKGGASGSTCGISSDLSFFIPAKWNLIYFENRERNLYLLFLPWWKNATD